MAVSHVKSNAVADATGTVTVWWGVTTSALSATDLVRPTDWNSAHNEFRSLAGNTNNASTASGTNLFYSAAGELTLFGSTATIGFSGRPHISSYVNIGGLDGVTMTLNGASVSDAVAFELPSPGSFSFLRIPALMTTLSTTIASTGATRNVSGEIYSTWNAVVYSMGTGANSRSLQSLASGSAGFTHRNSMSIAVNGTQYSVTQGFSAFAEGAGTTRTTQYSISNTNYSLTTDQIGTEWSSLRFIDIPFANSLPAGEYWLVFGYSSSSATNSAGAWTAAYGGKYSNHYGISQTDLAFRVMGSTNGTTGGYLGGGSFSTAGGGTTNSIPISAISSRASNVLPFFQLLRSA